MTKIKEGQLRCRYLIKAAEKAFEDAWENAPSIHSGDYRNIATPPEWFKQNISPTSYIRGVAKCNGCGGICEKRVTVHINLLESRLVYAERISTYEEVQIRVFNDAGQQRKSLEISGHPCLDDKNRT